ncbi:uncharacterized protein HKW66_Vig0047910 [Vigna angularis]|uniref:Uncharacterized protein n=1 Tax=Phaseolus angularis TaxID=3914 RepID=A0A8T0L0N2_PHAAN|nr:uncharacterized protein HKW66_Vig0047910 [Vigna angularis]
MHARRCMDINEEKKLTWTEGFSFSSTCSSLFLRNHRCGLSVVFLFLSASAAGQSDDDSDEENVEEPHNEVDEVVKEKGEPHRGRVEYLF